MSLLDKIESLKNKSKNLIRKTYDWGEKDSIKKISFLLIICISFFVSLLLNWAHPLFGDDWMYSMIGETNEHVSSFGDILYTQYQHYFTWGGRSVVHVIAQTLLWIGERPADILNSLAYVALTLVIYKFANAGNKTSPFLLLGINLLIYIFQPTIGDTVLWITGSANYLWGTLIIVSFLLPYRLYSVKDRMKNDSFLKTLLFLFGGVIAGWTNENMAIALITILILILIHYKYIKNQLPKWSIAGLVGVVIGACFMIAAPGNFARLDAMGATQESNFVQVFLKQFFTSVASYYYYSFDLLFVLAILVCIALKYTKSDERRRDTMISVFILFIGSVIGALAMSAAPFFPGRAAFGINTLLILAIAITYANLNRQNIFVKNISVVLIVFGLLFLTVDIYRGYKELATASKVLAQRNEAVIEGRKKGIEDFIFTEKVAAPRTRYFHYFELSHDSLNWHNQVYSKYYGIKSIKIADKEATIPND